MRLMWLHDIYSRLYLSSISMSIWYGILRGEEKRTGTGERRKNEKRLGYNISKENSVKEKHGMRENMLHACPFAACTVILTVKAVLLRHWQGHYGRGTWRFCTRSKSARVKKKQRGESVCLRMLARLPDVYSILPVVQFYIGSLGSTYYSILFSSSRSRAEKHAPRQPFQLLLCRLFRSCWCLPVTCSSLILPCYAI